MRHKIKLKLRNISIEKRLAYAFFLLSLIPILIVGTLSTKIAKDAIIDKSTNYIVQLVEAVEDNLQNELRNYEVLLNELMVNPLVQRAFQVYDMSTNAEKANMRNKISDILIAKLSSYPYIRDIKMVNLEEEVIYQRGYLLNDETHIKDMTESIREIGGHVQCFIQPIYGENYIVLSKRINSVYTQKEVGYILFVIKEDAVRMIYEDLDLGEGANISLIDQRNHIMSSQYESYQAIFSRNLLTQYKKAVNLKKSCFEYLDGYRRYTVVGSPMQKYGIDCIAIIPNNYFLKEINAMQEQVVLLVFTCFILSFIVSKSISKSIIDPLKKLKTYIASAMEEKFHTKYVDDSPDELGMLGRSYVEINNEMHEMINKIARDEKERRELELNMLQAQINPHFLFNTLNSLRWIAMMSGADSVSEGILALSDLLKNTIIQKEQYISIENELENVHNYMLIQKLRYGDSFRLTLDIEEDLLKCKTLKFILQPIVENAIIHGIRSDERILNINITLKEVEDGLCFAVEDDGKGFDMSQMECNEHKDIRLSGIGINNVVDRIRINFGEPYDVEIQSEVGRGTSVKLHIPKMGEI
ncbi:MAG: histidine kinase [Niameybacter sp.]